MGWGKGREGQVKFVGRILPVNGRSVDEGESAGVASAEAENGAWALWRPLPPVW